MGIFTDSVIRRMTRISDEVGAINLSQGFPDFDPPRVLMDALAKAAYEGPHQYSVTFGAPNLREALAKKQGRSIGRPIDPDREVVVTCGSTEAMMCAVLPCLRYRLLRAFSGQTFSAFHKGLMNADMRLRMIHPSWNGPGLKFIRLPAPPEI